MNQLQRYQLQISGNWSRITRKITSIWRLVTQELQALIANSHIFWHKKSGKGIVFILILFHFFYFVSLIIVLIAEMTLFCLYSGKDLMVSISCAKSVLSSLSVKSKKVCRSTFKASIIFSSVLILILGSKFYSLYA